MKVPRVLVVTDRRQLRSGQALEEVVAACVEAGAPWCWVREHDLSHPERAALVDRLARIPGAVIVTGRRWHPGAAGLHLQDGAPLVPGPAFHGRSCHDEDEVRRAVAGGASYVTISPVGVSCSKPGYGPPLGPGGVARAVAAAGDVPVLALGGVGLDNASSLVAAGAHGVAVMGSVMRAADPGHLVATLLAEVGS